MANDRQKPASNGSRRPKDALVNRQPRPVPAVETGDVALPLEQKKTGRGGNGKSEPPVASKKDTYKETIAMIKDTLDVAWKVAPVALLPAALFVWSYLRSIHWTSLFQASTVSGSGLIFLFVAATLIAVAVLLQFIAPSLFMIGAMWNYRQEVTLPKTIPWLFCWATGGWLAGFAWGIVSGKSQVWIIFAAAFLFAIIYGLCTQKSLGISGKNSRKLPLTALNVGGLALAAVATLTMTSLPLLLSLHAAEPYASGGWCEKLLVFAVCLITTVVSMLPGLMYLLARTWRSGFYQPLKLAILGGFLLSYVVVSGAAAFVPISSSVLKLAGIYSNEPQSFQILQPNLTAALGAAKIPVQKSEQTSIITAYVRYDFGGVRLLCRQPFNEALVTADAIKSARDHHAPDPTVLAGSGCVQATSSELRPLRM